MLQTPRGLLGLTPNSAWGDLMPREVGFLLQPQSWAPNPEAEPQPSCWPQAGPAPVPTSLQQVRRAQGDPGASRGVCM